MERVVHAQARGELHLAVEAHKPLGGDAQVERLQGECIDERLFVGEMEFRAPVLEAQVGELPDLEGQADGFEEFELPEAAVADLELAGAFEPGDLFRAAVRVHIPGEDSECLPLAPAGIGAEFGGVHPFHLQRGDEGSLRFLALHAEAPAHCAACECGDDLRQIERAARVAEGRAHGVEGEPVIPHDAADLGGALQAVGGERGVAHVHTGEDGDRVAILVEEFHGAVANLKSIDQHLKAALFRFLPLLPLGLDLRCRRCGGGGFLCGLRHHPFSLGILRPDDVRGVHAHLGDDELSAEERREPVACAEGGGVEEIDGAIRDRDTRDLQVAPWRKARVRDGERHAQDAAELLLDARLRARRLDVEIHSQERHCREQHHRRARDENRLGKFFHGPQPTRRPLKEKAEPAPA